MQLQQRIITSGPIENLKPPPLFANVGLPSDGETQQSRAHVEEYEEYSQPAPCGRGGHSQYASHTQGSGGHTRSPSGQFNRSSAQYKSPVRAGAPPHQAPPIQYPGSSHRAMLLQANSVSPQPQGCITELSSGSASPTSSDGFWASPSSCQDHRLSPKIVTTITNSRNEKMEKGHLSSVTKMKFFGKRSKATPVTISKSGSPRLQELEASEFHRRTAQGLQAEKPHNDKASYTKVKRPKQQPPPPPTPSSRYSMFSDTAVTASIYEPPETPDFNPWADRSLSVTPATTRSVSEASRSSTLRSSGSIRRAPGSTPIQNCISPRGPKELLPSEENKFQGFCKGAWRAQIGDRKKAMEERQRPGGMYNAARFWQCSKCKFEGRLLMLDKKTKTVDKRVLTAEGIQFRWDFLFKSHIETKDVTTDFLSATFGCMFCTAEGRGTPTFGGAPMLMAHLQEHRERLPSGEVLYRMNALVGPRAALDEDFDINIVGKEGVDV